MQDFIFTTFVHALFMVSGAWLGIAYYRQRWVKETTEVMQEIADQQANTICRVMTDAYNAGLKDGKNAR